MAVARNAVEHKRVVFGMKAAQLCLRLDIIAPEPDRVSVRNQFAFARVFYENASEFAVNGQVAEHVAAGAVVEIRDGAKNPPLRAFAGAGRANEQNGAVFHSFNLLRPCAGFARTESPRTAP